MYGKTGLNVVFLQQRSPVMRVSVNSITSLEDIHLEFTQSTTKKALKTDFVSGLQSLVLKNEISAVFILSGMDLSDRPEAHME